MMNVYSVFDNIAEKFGNPFVAISDKVAIRDFNVGLSSMSALIKKDYSLRKIGTFDENSGKLIGCESVLIAGSPENVEIIDTDVSQLANLKEMLKDE